MKRIKKLMGKKSELTPEQRDDRRGLGYAAAIHAALFAFMLLSFVASPRTPNPVQVELWADGTTPTAAEPDVVADEVSEPEVTPPEPEPEPQPDPEPQPEPEPTPQPEPTPEPEPTPPEAEQTPAP